MLSRWTRYCAEHRRGVLFWTIILMALGGRAALQLAIDVYPDLSPTQVLVISRSPGRSSREMEQQVTIPVEIAMANVPSVAAIRSRTIFGLSVVEVIFEEGVDKFFARQRVEELLPAVELPAGVRPLLGPLATAYGEIFRYELQGEGTRDLRELQTLNTRVIAPRLERVSGVTEVVNFGGLERQFTVKLNPRHLERYGFSLQQVLEAIRTNNANAGGSVLRRGDMAFDIRGHGALKDVRDLESTVIDTVDGAPVYVRDVANVEIASRIPLGVFGKDERNESIEGIILMTRDDNPTATLAALRSEVDAINTSVLPDGVQIVPFYDRQELVERVQRTAVYTAGCGVALVLLMLIVFLGSVPLALLVALTIPVGFLFALVPMQSAGATVRLLSIGAIDYGILVWGAVIMVDQAVLRVPFSTSRIVDTQLHAAQLQQAVSVATDRVDNAILISMLIVAGVHLPLLAQTGIEGLIFRPMAWTALLSLLGGALYTLFVLPALLSWVFRNGYDDWSNPVLRKLGEWYAADLASLLGWRRPIVLFIGVLAAGTLAWSFPRLGGDFLPPVDEGVAWIRASFPEGIALDQTAEFGDRVRAIPAKPPGSDGRFQIVPQHHRRRAVGTALADRRPPAG
jgi:cobalt-zinc-cadmium resistance protein CzcA